MNMKEVIAAGLHFVSCLSPLKGQPTIFHVRLIFSLLFICVLPRHAMGPDSGRLDFICHPMISDFHKQLCFSHYSAEMSPLMGPYYFVLVTACALFVLWTTMIQYSYLHLQKSRRVKLLSEKKCLCHGFRKMILFHLASEAVVLSVILGIFCYTQKIHFPETYNCSVMIAMVITCRDQHHWVKSIFNIVFIGGMASILLLCIATVCQAVRNKEKLIKELLVLSNTVYAADDDDKRHRNTQSHSEKRVAGVPDDIFQVIVNDFTIRENFLESLVFPMCFPISYTFLIVRGLSEWIEDICSVMNSGELEERDKILDVLEQLPLSEALDQRITERAVMHRKRNTVIAQDRDESFPVSVSRMIVAIVARWLRQIFMLINRGGVEERAVMHRKRNTVIAQDRDESFPVSVSRRIVAIVARWLRQIFVLINRGGVEERDKILDIVKQLPLSEVLDQRITERAVMHRKHNTDIAQDRDESFQVSVSGRIVAIVVKWMEEIFRVVDSGKREERDKIFDLFKQLQVSEVHDRWNTKRAVMHRKRNTDIAQDCDESFEVSVRRRIVAIVARWLRQIFMLINRGGVEERDEILDMLEQLPLSEALDQRITERDSFPFW